MTLPFRRRHNDHEASHDRARAIVATSFFEPTEPADAAWLESHLGTCPECRADAEAYRADRELLRGLREQQPEPPRDLWARTAASIELEGRRAPAGRAAGHSLRTSLGSRRIGRVPLGAMSGILVVLVVVGVSLFPRGIDPLGSPPAGSDTAVHPSTAEATPIAVVSDQLAWIEGEPNGSYSLKRTTVSQVCPALQEGCAPLGAVTSTPLNLAQAPQALVLSPSREQLVVVTAPGASAGADVVVVALPPQQVDASPSPVTSESPSVSPAASGSPASTPTPTPTPTATGPAPSGSPSGSPEPSSSALPVDRHAIASGVIVVGDASYSDNGQWLAFAARPATGDSGPDLFLWHVGDPLATAVTSDHRTFFAGWLGNLALASRILPTTPAVPDGSTAPGGSGSAAPASTPSTSPSASPGATTNLSFPDGSAAPTQPPVEEHPVSFLFDPAAGSVIPLIGTDIWHPTVDPTGTFIVYWAGTLIPDGTGTGWNLGSGSLVIDRWLNGQPLPSGDPTSSANPSASATPSPSAAANPSAAAVASLDWSRMSGVLMFPGTAIYGPAGHGVPLTDVPVPDFDAWFDPTGTRLAIWIEDPSDPKVGTLRLIVPDPITGAVDPAHDPLPGVAALRGISINAGRLAWVTPPGQDGEGSHVQILAWSGDDFGQVRTIQGERVVVVR